MGKMPTRGEAWELLCEYNKDEFLGWELDELIERTIMALREVEQTTGLV